MKANVDKEQEASKLMATLNVTTTVLQGEERTTYSLWATCPPSSCCLSMIFAPSKVAMGTCSHRFGMAPLLIEELSHTLRALL